MTQKTYIHQPGRLNEIRIETCTMWVIHKQKPEATEGINLLLFKSLRCHRIKELKYFE